MSETSERAGEFQIFEVFNVPKTPDFSEYASSDKYPLISKIPAQPSASYFGQEAGDPEKEGWMIVMARESTPYNPVF